MIKVFISHVEEDAELASAIAVGLEEAGIVAWLYQRDSVPGVSYLIQTGQAIEECSVFILLVSDYSVDSYQVSKEVERAHECEKNFLPLLVDLTQDEFQERQPMWRQAIGTQVTIDVPSDGVEAIIPRILQGLKQLGIDPSGKAAPPIQKFKKRRRKSRETEKILLDLGGRVAVEGTNIYVIGYKPSSKGIVGRNELAADCVKSIAELNCGFLCLYGPGGIGKSSLAGLIISKFAEIMPGRFDRISWYDLRQEPDPETVLLHLATIVTGGKIPAGKSGKPSFDNLLNLLRTGQVNSPTLVVLDNLDSTFDVGAEAGSFPDDRWPRILRAFQGGSSAVIVTSRQVPRFQDKTASFVRVDGLSSEDAIRLLREAGLKDSDEILAGAHRLLLGHPMALNALAAAVMRRPSYSKRLERAGEIMDAIQQCPDPTQNPVSLFEEVINPNYLPGTELSILLSMPVLFRAETSGAIAALNPELETGEVDRALDELYLRSLVQTDTDDDPPFYSLHPLIREVVKENCGNLRLLHELAYEYYSSLPWDRNSNNPNEVEHLRLAVLHALAIGNLERANLILYEDCALSDRLVSWGRYDLALPLHQLEFNVAKEKGIEHAQMRPASQLSRCLLRLGHTEDSLEYGEQALAIAENKGDKENLCKYRSHIGRILFLKGEFDRAFDWLTATLEIAEELCDRKREGRIRLLIGQILMHRGEFGNSLEWLEKAHSIAVEIGDRLCEIESHMVMSRVYFFRGDCDIAIKLLSKARSKAVESGDKLNESKIHGLLGQIQMTMGDFEAASEKFQEAMKVDTEIGDRRHEGAIRAQFAVICNYRGEYEKAIELLEKSIEITTDIKSRAAEAFYRGNLGQAHLGMGKLDEAMEQIQKAYEFSIESRDRTNECVWRGKIGEVFLNRKEYDSAMDWFQHALEIALEIKDMENESELRGLIGQVLLEQEDYESAQEWLEKALDLVLEITSPAIEWRHRLNLGELYLATGRIGDAIPHLECALEITRNLGMTEALINEVESSLSSIHG